MNAWKNQMQGKPNYIIRFPEDQKKHILGMKKNTISAN